MSGLRTGAWGDRWRGRRFSGGLAGLRLAGVCSLVLVSVFVLGVASAVAATGHGFLSGLSEAPVGTALGEPVAVAVDHASGDVFVGDPAAGVVDVFSSTGSYVTRFGEGLEPVAVAVDEATGVVYVAEPASDSVLVFKPNGAGGYESLSEWSGAAVAGGEFGEVGGVAVDNSTSAVDPSAGDVFVVDRENSAVEGGVVDVFKPKPAGGEEAKEGDFVRALSGVKLVEPNGVAVSAGSGREYVADSAKGTVYEFNSSGVYEAKVTGTGSPQGSFRGKEEEEGNVAGIGVDETTGDLLVAEAERRVVSEFNAAGEWVGWITRTPTGGLGEPRGVALAAAGGVYVADAAAHVVDVFGPGVVVASVSSKSASKLTRTTGVLNGVVNGEGKPVRYHFEWGTSEAYGSSTPVIETGGVEEKVTALLGELHAGTTYYFRLVGEDENGINVGAGLEFTTPPAVEGVSTGKVEGLGQSAATLTGSLTPGGVEASYYFEWGTSASYGNMTPSTNAGAGAEAVSAKATLAGLTANTTYFYRIVAVNSFGVTVGEGAKFTTSGPPRITNEATSPIGHETATIKAKIDPDELASEYHFEYGETTAYGSEAPVGGAKLAAGETPVAVSAALSGLKPGVSYHFRVLASNAAGTTVGADQTFTTVPPALIDSESVTEVSATSATLQTQINPLGHDTTYYFQYGSASCEASPLACTAAPGAPGTDIGAGESDVPGSVVVQELQPGTTYYYRVLATNSLGTAAGLQHTFTTQPAATAFALPDARAWEMVTPPDKHGAPVEALTREGGWILASESGDALSYLAGGAITEEVQGNRSPEVQQVLATRASGGWSSQDLVTPQTRAQGVGGGKPPEYQFFSPGLSLALLEPPGVGPEPPLAPDVTQKTMYLRDDHGASISPEAGELADYEQAEANSAFFAPGYLPLVTEADVAAGTIFQDQVRFVDATPDLSHVLLASKVPLTGPSSAPGLYEWSAGKLQLVSILAAGTPAPKVEAGYYRVVAHSISDDGSRVFWTTPEETGQTGHLYMRDTLNGETVQLDAAEKGVSEPLRGAAQFQIATGDGSRVLFTDKQRLTADSTAEPALGKADLYECEIVEENEKPACRLKDLTVERNEGEHAAVQGLLFGASENGSSVYLVAQGVLAANKNGSGESAQPGGDNLYALNESAGNWETTFIAGLSKEDKPEWEGEVLADPAYLTARVSPNGRYLAFMSDASPTGYDNIDQNSGKRDEEVYLYDFLTASLTCASCDPTGARPVGVLDTQEAGEGLGLLVDQRKVWIGRWIAGNVPGWTAQESGSALYQSRYLLNDGRLFFNSPDDLVPRATNHKENVYQYEPNGIGSCQSTTGGCVALLSSGSSDRESAFLEATPSGNDVFFLTAAQLLPQDTDTAFDIYDARVCTPQSPCLTPPTQEPAPCRTTEGCRPASPAQQAPSGPSGSANVTGTDNIPAPAKQDPTDTKPSTKPLTQAQKLAHALKACEKHYPHSKNKRQACQTHARKLYGPKTKASKSANARRSSRAPSKGRSGR